MVVFHLFSDRPEMSTGNSKFIGSAAQFRLIQQTTIFSPTQMSNIHILEEKKCHVIGCDQMNLSKDFASINDSSSFRRSRRTKLFHDHA